MLQQPQQQSIQQQQQQQQSPTPPQCSSINLYSNNSRTRRRSRIITITSIAMTTAATTKKSTTTTIASIAIMRMMTSLLSSLLLLLLVSSLWSNVMVAAQTPLTTILLGGSTTTITTTSGTITTTSSTSGGGVLEQTATSMTGQFNTLSQYPPYAILFQSPKSSNVNSICLTIDEVEQDNPNIDICMDDFNMIRSMIYPFYVSSLLVETTLTSMLLSWFDHDVTTHSEIYTTVNNIVDGSLEGKNVLVVQQSLSSSLPPSMMVSASPSRSPSARYDTTLTDQVMINEQGMIITTWPTIPDPTILNTAQENNGNTNDLTVIIEIVTTSPPAAPPSRRQLQQQYDDDENDDDPILPEQEIIPMASSSSLSLLGIETSSSSQQQQQQSHQSSQSHHRRLALCTVTICRQSKPYISLVGCTRYCSKLRKKRRLDVSTSTTTTNSCDGSQTYIKGYQNHIIPGRGDVIATLFYQYVQTFLSFDNRCQELLLNMTYVTVDLDIILTCD